MAENFPKPEGNRYSDRKHRGSQTRRTQTDPYQDITKLKWEKSKIKRGFYRQQEKLNSHIQRNPLKATS